MTANSAVYVFEPYVNGTAFKFPPNVNAVSLL